MSPSSADLLRQVKSEIDEVDPSEVKELLQEGVAIVDLRETDEISSGLLPGAKHVPRARPGHREPGQPEPQDLEADRSVRRQVMLEPARMVDLGRQ